MKGELTIQILTLTFPAHHCHEFHRQLEVLQETTIHQFHAESAQNTSKLRLT